MGNLFSALSVIDAGKPGNIGSIKLKFLFLWTGQFTGNNLQSDIDDKVITVLDKDFSTSYIPNTSAATLKIPFDGYWDIADSDNLWHNNISRRLVSVNDLTRCDYARTFIKYSDSDPHHIQAIGILDPTTILTNADKAYLTRTFGLHKYFWGSLNLQGTVKSNRNSSALNTFLIGAQYYNSGDYIRFEFNKQISNFSLDHITLKINGVVKPIMIFQEWEPYYIQRTDAERIANPGDIIEISISSGLLGIDSIPIVPVVDLLVTNTMPENARIYSRSGHVISQPHGCVLAGSRIFIGERNTPTVITRFNNLDDLTDITQVTITGYGGADTMCYDAVNNKIYFIADDGDDSFGLKIFKMDPDTMAYEIVYANESIDTGHSSAIETDGEHFYIITYAIPAMVHKFRISDWTLLLSNEIIGCSAGHNLCIHKYNNRVELYSAVRMDEPEMLGVRSYAVKFVKIQGSDLSYQQVKLIMSIPTDDIAFYYENESGGKAYVVGEFEDDIMMVIDTATMTITNYVPVIGSWCASNNGNDLLVLSAHGHLINYENRDFTKPPVFRKCVTGVNEHFYKNNSNFITTFSQAEGELYEFGTALIDNALMNNDKSAYLTSEDEQYYLIMED